MRIDIDSRRLRLFVEVVRQGGFSQAAKAVSATQPTVSKAIKQLEGELGVVLLDRAGHRSEPTAAGRIVYRHATTLLNETGDLMAELDELQGLKRGTLILGFPRIGTSALFAQLFANFRSQYPGVEVELVVHDGRRLEELLRGGEVDLAVLMHPIPDGFDTQHVRTDPLMVLLPRDHALAGRPSVRMDKLADLPLILFEEGSALNEMIIDACRARGFTPKIAAQSGQVDFILELVAADFGIGFLPRGLAEQRPHRRVACVMLHEPKCKWRISLAWRHGRYLSSAARAWLAHAREECDKVT
jgi:DNA-binding transcriptional LysR family regulator